MHYVKFGEVPAKRHIQFRQPDGSLYFEQMIGEEGFGGAASLLYHRYAPNALVDAYAWEVPDGTTTQSDHPLVPRHLKLHELFKSVPDSGVDVVTGRRLLMGNEDVRISYVMADQPSPLFSNATGDELLYLETGAARLETVFGDLELRTGDFVIIPRTCTYRMIPEPNAEIPLRVLFVETSGHVTAPKRHLSQFGQFLEGSPITERDLRIVQPSERTFADPGTGEVEVYVKHRGSGGKILGTVHVLPHHPFDVVGWDGCLYPYAVNIDAYEPITGRIHQPPPMHQLFEGTGFVICTLVPRRLDDHDLAIPLPYYHANVDSDEVLFYCGGDYTARKGTGIGLGSMSFHPTGYIHGPMPGAYQNCAGLERTNEIAVMIDTWKPLEMGEGADACNDPGYAWAAAGGRVARNGGTGSPA